MYPTFTFLVTFVLFCFCSVCVLSLGCVFAFHFNSHFLSKFLCVLFSFHSKIYICVLFGESPGFSPRWDSLSLSPSHFVQFSVHNVGTQGRWVPLGNSLAIIKQHKTRVFRGLSLFQPPISICNHISSFSLIISVSKLAMLLAKQSVTGRRIA